MEQNDSASVQDTFSNVQLFGLVMYVLNNLCKCLIIQLNEYPLIFLNINDYKDSILLQAINLYLFKIYSFMASRDTSLLGCDQMFKYADCNFSFYSKYMPQW